MRMCSDCIDQKIVGFTSAMRAGGPCVPTLTAGSSVNEPLSVWWNSTEMPSVRDPSDLSGSRLTCVSLLADAVGNTYLFDLDFNDQINLYTVDAAVYGNVSHFINHSVLAHRREPLQHVQQAHGCSPDVEF